MNDYPMTSKSKANRTTDELVGGLGRWVEDYKAARLSNPTLARQIKAKIDARIAECDLDGERVYGV